MKTFDILILGNENTAQSVAEHLSPTKKKIGIVLPKETDLFPLTQILHFLKKGSPAENKVLFPPNMEIIEGSPIFIENHVVQVGEERLESKKIVLAIGSQLYVPPLQGLDQIPLTPLLTLLTQDQKPKSLLVIGAGPLGVSLASYFADQKTEVTLIGNHHQVLPDEEPEIAAAVGERLTQKKIHVQTAATLLQIRRENNQVVLVLEQDGQRQEKQAEEIVFATGLLPRTEGLNLQKPAVYVNEDKAVAVDETMRTSCPWIFAVGTITGGKTSGGLIQHQVRLASHNLVAPFFAQQRMEDEPTPFTIPLDPPVARVGLTEREARAQYKDVRVSLTIRPEGLIKLVGRKKGARLLGAHIFSPHAEEAILYFNLAMRAEISLLDLLDGEHYPPLTFAEVVGESIKAWTQSIP